MQRNRHAARHLRAHSIAAVDEDVAVDLLNNLRRVSSGSSVGSSSSSRSSTCSSCATDTRKIHAMLSSDL